MSISGFGTPREVHGKRPLNILRTLLGQNIGKDFILHMTSAKVMLCLAIFVRSFSKLTFRNCVSEMKQLEGIKFLDSNTDTIEKNFEIIISDIMKRIKA